MFPRNIVRGELGWVGLSWVGFLVVCVIYILYTPRSINPNPRKIICRGKQVAQMPLLKPDFSWVGFWPLGWGVRLFDNIHDTLSSHNRIS